MTLGAHPETKRTHAQHTHCVCGTVHTAQRHSKTTSLRVISKRAIRNRPRQNKGWDGMGTPSVLLTGVSLDPANPNRARGFASKIHRGDRVGQRKGKKETRVRSTDPPTARANKIISLVVSAPLVGLPGSGRPSAPTQTPLGTYRLAGCCATRLVRYEPL